MRTINKIITKVSGKYGAPMGRANKGQNVYSSELDKEIPLTTHKVFDCAVPMSDSCYDKGGVYWGSSSQLRVAYTKDLSYVFFYRRGDKNFTSKIK